MPCVVGLIGRKRSGKDTVAGIWLAAGGWERVAFADPLKAVMLSTDPLLPPAPIPGNLAPTGPVRLSELVGAVGWEGAKENPEVRRLLQAHGVGVREHINDRIWLDAALARIDEKVTEGLSVVVTDVRFPNEAEAIWGRPDGVLVRVERPGLDVSDTHVSETALDDWEADHTLLNNSTLSGLQEAARYLLKNYL